MSHVSTSTTEAEPPLGDQPPPSENELTLDLGEPGLADLTLDEAENGIAAFDITIDAPSADQVDAADVTVDLPQAPEASLIGCELQKGKYLVLSRRGGAQAHLSQLGASYSALHTDLQKRLTLRYLPLDPDASDEQREQTMMQFLREVRVLAKLSHPSLPRVHDYFCEGAACYVVMDELSERTLADVLADAVQEGFVPALPPVMIAQLGLELARALGYLHQQRPPLVLGGLRAEDIAVPADGPAQLMSLGALSMIPSVSSESLPGFVSMPTLPVPVQGTKVDTLASLPPAPEAAAPADDEETLTEEAPAPAAAASPPEPGDDLYSLGVLLRELAGGAEVVARVMERLQRPEEALQADGADDAPLISLALAGVIQIAAHEEPARRFQSAAAFETALLRAWMVERRIVSQAERGWRDERATRLENGEDDRAATSVDVASLQARQHREVATRHFSVVEARVSGPQVTVCWRCGGHNEPGTLVCRVCGARQPLTEERSASAPRSGVRPTRRLPPGALEDSGWAEWGEETEEATPMPSARTPASPRRTRPLPYRQTAEGVWTSGPLRRASMPVRSRQASGQRLLWALVWVCFSMAFVLGSATVVVTYLALR